MSAAGVEVAPRVSRGGARGGAAPRAASAWTWRAALVAIILTSGLATGLAMLRTSATFDEIVLLAGGARGYHTGRFDLAPDHPPIMQYLYGVGPYLSRPSFPVEEPGKWVPKTRYEYAGEFMWRMGNPSERYLLQARLAALAIAMGLVLATYALGRRVAGPAAGVAAAGLLAFLPDVLGHGGVAYNDVPATLAFLGAVWAIDEAARRPTPVRGVLAGIVVALAATIKFSTVVIAPVALLLVAAEALSRPADRRWAMRLGIAVAVALAVTYLGIALAYRGDFALSALRDGLAQAGHHAHGPGGAPNYFLGHRKNLGWWYFYPLAFFFKTPVAFQALVLLGIGGLLLAGVRVRRVLASPLRLPLIAGAGFGVALLFAHLDIGFRYALPALPMLCVLAGAGLVRLWARVRPAMRAVVATLAAGFAVSSLAAYPWFLSYTSEWGPGQDRAWRVFADSNIDWGQGLYALRDFMLENDVPRVYLSYFGSAYPAAYGIRYVALPSYFTLPTDPDPGGAAPTYAVVSVTNVVGPYFPVNRLAFLQGIRPERVLGGSMLVYRCSPRAAPPAASAESSTPATGTIDCSRLPVMR